MRSSSANPSSPVRHASALDNLETPAPDTEVPDALQANIADFAGQRAVRALVTDAKGAQCELPVASNQGYSSSIVDMNEHRDIWPDVTYRRTVSMASPLLDPLIRREGVDLGGYDALAMNTQVAGPLVRKGATQALRRSRYVKTEAADFESYEGGCREQDVVEFLASRGFRKSARVQFAAHLDGGVYFDILFRRAE